MFESMGFRLIPSTKRRALRTGIYFIQRSEGGFTFYSQERESKFNVEVYDTYDPAIERLVTALVGAYFELEK